eukprot:gene46048-16475_t
MLQNRRNTASEWSPTQTDMQSWVRLGGVRAGAEDTWSMTSGGVAPVGMTRPSSSSLVPSVHASNPIPTDELLPDPLPRDYGAGSLPPATPITDGSLTPAERDTNPSSAVGMLRGQPADGPGGAVARRCPTPA